MRCRRILSLWFPRLGAECLLRRMRGLPPGLFAIVGEEANRQVLTSLSAEAEAKGLYLGQPLPDARAMCPDLVTRIRNPQIEAAFLAALRRWAGRFSPWVGEEAPDGLIIDLTGAAHLFGGEEGVLAAVAADCEGLGLTVEAGIADTVGTAWGLARYAGKPGAVTRNGDAIDQEARATRSRSAKRHWIRGGAAPVTIAPPAPVARIATPGQTRQALASLPLAALRIDEKTVHGLARLGLRHVGDILGTPRAPLTRRFGRELVRRLDQALGLEEEPVSPARPPLHFAVRLTLPDPIGLTEDIMAGLDRLLPALCDRLRARGQGARRVRLQLFHADHRMQEVEIGLARASADPAMLRPLLALKLTGVEAGFGIDTLRLEAHVTEPVQARQHRGPYDPVEGCPEGEEFEKMVSRLGTRVGMEAITRLVPVDTHIPEKTAKILPVAWSKPAETWPPPCNPRPVVLFRCEPVQAHDDPMVPARFRWRRRDLVTASATGPERIAPEWWLDEPGWRSGTRDYWRVEVTTGERLWLYYAYGGAVPGGWFCQGVFA
ncbi:DNA polymerase Y family protein [Defluviimonas sp. WL0050]|uniref:DNA-directed DNA polymerase n=1 Tax=Albidovulum litorale TaxID=2984134 RepID=A0ABT2ZR29_9RHOB|nr:DNA polymerase Y family protein [Defluviimonas sp. WL0050]MCV2873468.1 DNA polymerase Y family protein [Defluviimonas sp. WL0050]